jgi:2-amino-4-hydroxy-6-hydroxymethyldihydropteridine diphosphokinase
MKSQHQVILSIGSNLGNRLENIERSLELIHQEVGTIIKVSRLYETPAWVLKVMLLQLCAGFVFLHRHKSVKSSFKIEKRLGRLRNKVQEYQSRTIDIDLIASIQKLLLPKTGDSASINAKQNFVLLPIQDLNLD